MFMNLEMLLGLVLLFLMIRNLVMDICLEGLVWKLEKYSAVKTLHIW